MREMKILALASVVLALAACVAEAGYGRSYAPPVQQQLFNDPGVCTTGGCGATQAQQGFAPQYQGAGCGVQQQALQQGFAPQYQGVPLQQGFAPAYAPRVFRAPVYVPRQQFQQFGAPVYSQPVFVQRQRFFAPAPFVPHRGLSLRVGPLRLGVGVGY